MSARRTVGLLLVALLTAPRVEASAQTAGTSKLKKVTDALGAAAEARQKKKTTERYDPIFQKYTKRYFGIDFDWHPFKAQGMAESNLNATARSRVGARGIMQLMPATFQAIRSAKPEFQAIDNPEHNIAAGIMHDRYLWKLYPLEEMDERLRFMFAAYNAGEGTIKRARSVAEREKLDATRWANVEAIAPKVKPWRYRETLGYVRKIDENRARLKGTDR